MEIPGAPSVAAPTVKEIKATNFKGVCWDKRCDKWLAQIQKDGKKSYLGYFGTDEEAARKYDEVAATLGRPLNFPTAKGEASAVKMNYGGSSKFKGVCWDKGMKKWRAEIKVKGKKNYMGCFDEEEEAARKYDEIAAALGRPLNFKQGTPDIPAQSEANPRASKRTKVSQV